MRTLIDHVTLGDSANHQLQIEILDEPKLIDNVSHSYGVSGFDPSTNDSCDGHAPHLGVLFQNGPIKEKGVNGVTQEALLAIVIDRLRCFQKGPFSCRENAIALTHCEDALMWLQRRTVDRIRRGVEGQTKA